VTGGPLHDGPLHAESGGSTSDRSPTIRPWMLGLTITYAMAMGNLLQFALGALAPILTVDLDLSRTELGTLPSVYFLGGVLLSTRMGRLTDRYGGRSMLLVLFLGVAVSLLAIATSPNYPWLLLATVSAAVPLATSNPATNQLVAVHLPPGRQGVLLGIKQSGVQVSAFVAGFVLPSAAVWFGWRTVLAGCATLGLAGAAVTARSIPRARRTVRRNAKKDTAPLPKLVRWLAVYAALMGSGLSALITYLPLYGTEELGLGVAAAGTTAGTMGLIGMGARVQWARVAERRSASRESLRTMGLIATGATALLLLAPAAPMMVWVSAAALGASSGAWLSVAMLAVVRGVDRASAGRASGVVLAGFYLGMVTAPPLFGWSVDRLGSYQPGWVAITLLTAGSAAVMHRYRPTPVGVA
jgi:predicted MFS family arabinose efflux permease